MMFKPVSKTAFYSAGVRVLDAQSSRPILRDTLAQRVMGKGGLEIFEPFRRFTYPNGANIARHKIIDDALKERFKGRPQRRTIVIGAGLDTRPYRMKTGEWVELDEPLLLSYKERNLPAAECPVPLERIPIDFSKDSLADRLTPFATKERVSIVIEGITMYLEEQQVANMARTLVKLFPDHSLICDLVTRKFIGRYGRRFRQAIESLGAQITWAPDEPVKVFEANGYDWIGAASIAQRAAELRTIPMPPWAVSLLPGLRDGYAVHVFKPA